MLAALPEKARKLPKDRPPAGWQGIDKPPAYARIISRIHWKGAASWQKSNAEKKDYDLLDVVMVCLGQKKYNELTGLLSMLNLVLKDNYLSSADKREKLTKEFHVEITPELEKGVADMCNLSAGIERQGIEQGIKQGIEQGRAEGKIEMVLELLKENQPLDLISRVSKYSKEKITEIARLHGVL
ncbi:MAG: hypothetical protein IKN68_01545 [Spirochaetia bacterium]|nr:hypothetical protein [Spirochaetia bacterium]